MSNANAYEYGRPTGPGSQFRVGVAGAPAALRALAARVESGEVLIGEVVVSSCAKLKDFTTTTLTLTFTERQEGR